MRTTFRILPALASFVFLPLSAKGQPTGTLTCQSELERADAYVPALCDPKQQHPLDLNDVLFPGEEMDIWPGEEPKMDWAAARKICDLHTEGYAVDGWDAPQRTIYEEKFRGSCAAVDAHFDEEKHRKEVAEQIQRDAQAAKDLSRLNDFLAGSASQ